MLFQPSVACRSGTHLSCNYLTFFKPSSEGFSTFDMKIRLLFFPLLLLGFSAAAQELYPYAEPASNMPSRSVAVKTTALFSKDRMGDRTMQRYMPEVMFGLNKDWMVHGGGSFSNMFQPAMIWEGARLYAKYRFLSNDDVHKHFRMAAFGLYNYSRNNLNRNEINLTMGDQSGVQAGVIATQLVDKFAVSGTLAWNEVLDGLRSDKRYQDLYAYRSVSYSLSAGYLLLPFEYRDYDQTNLNLYVELLGGRNINFPSERYYVDLAPSIQAIFKSTAKLNVGYRFQLASDIDRLMKNSLMVSFEYIFLDALRKRAK